MRKAMFVGLSVIAMGALAACSDGSGDASNVSAPQVDVFELQEHTETRTVGYIRTVDGQLHFAATQGGSDTLGVRLNVNGKIFEGALNTAGTTVVIDGHGSVLTDADRNLVSAFHPAFASAMERIAVHTQDDTLYAFAAHLSTAPEGHVHGRIVSVTPTTVEEPEPVAAFAAADSVTTDAGTPPTTPIYGDEKGATTKARCLTRGTTVWASYTAGKTTTSPKIAEPVLVGSNWGTITSRTGSQSNYDCMGKCGAACTNNIFVANKGYSKDCLDHDTCSYRYKAAGQGSDPMCGDEFDQASDDAFDSSCKP